MLINKATSDALDVLYNQFFNLNALFDNAVSYMLNEWCMPNASNIIHHNLAHGFPIMADMISEIKDNYDERSIRMELPRHDEEYSDLSDMMNTLYEYCAKTFKSLLSIAIRLACLSISYVLAQYSYNVFIISDKSLYSSSCLGSSILIERSS